MTEQMKVGFKVRFGDEWPENAYSATGECPNCGDIEALLIRQGVPLSKVKLKCQRCRAANLTVRL